MYQRRELMTNLLLKCYELAVSLQQEMEHLFLWGYGTCVRALGVLSGCNVPAWPYRGFPQPMTPCLPSSISSPSHKHVQLHYCQVSDPGYGGLTLELLCIRHCNSCSHKPWAWQMQNHDLSTFLPLWHRASGTPGMSCRLRTCTRAVTTTQPTRADMLSHRNLVEAELFISLYYKDKMLPPLKAVAKLWLALQQPTSRPSGHCPWSWKARMWMVPFTAYLL